MSVNNVYFFIFHRFVNPVFYLLPKLHGMLKTHCLECVLSRADVIPDIYLHLKTKGLTQIMSHKSVNTAVAHISIVLLALTGFYAWNSEILYSS